MNETKVSKVKQRNGTERTFTTILDAPVCIAIAENRAHLERHGLVVDCLSGVQSARVCSFGPASTISVIPDLGFYGWSGLDCNNG
jgi:hypothetical protein